MANKTSRFTNPLDVGAMYEIGAAGAGNILATRKAKETQALGIVRGIGNMALNFITGVKRKQAASREAQNTLFTGIDNTLKDADIIDKNVTELKNKLTNANEILNSLTGSLFQNSDRYKQAQTDANEAEYALKNLGEQWKWYTPWKKNMIGLFNGDKKYYEHSTTLLEKYNTSLLASGDFDNAVFSDGNGDLRVAIENVEWDNPKTEKVETAEDYIKKGAVKDYTELIKEGKLTSIALRDMPFIADFDKGGNNLKGISADSEHIGDNHINDIETLAFDGKPVNFETKKHLLSKNINELGERNFMNYVFNGDLFPFTDDDGTSTSIFDKLVKDSESQIVIDDPATIDIDESNAAGPYDTNFDGKIDDIEKLGAETIIRQGILSGDYNRDSVIELFHNKGEKAYRDKFTENPYRTKKTTPTGDKYGGYGQPDIPTEPLIGSPKKISWITAVKRRKQLDNREMIVGVHDTYTWNGKVYVGQIEPKTKYSPYQVAKQEGLIRLNEDETNIPGKTIPILKEEQEAVKRQGDEQTFLKNIAGYLNIKK